MQSKVTGGNLTKSNIIDNNFNSRSAHIYLSPRDWLLVRQAVEHKLKIDKDFLQGEAKLVTKHEIIELIKNNNFLVPNSLDYNYVIMPVENENQAKEYKIGVIGTGKKCHSLDVDVLYNKKNTDILNMQPPLNESQQASNSYARYNTERNAMLGVGSEAVASLIFWEDGTFDSCRVLKNSDSEFHSNEIDVLKSLHRYVACFTAEKCSLEMNIVEDNKSKAKKEDKKSELTKIDNPEILIQKFIPGVSLYEFMQSKSWSKYPLLDRLKLLIGICYATADLHKKNIYHGDLNWGNIIINPKSQKIALIDFSFSGSYDDSQSYLCDGDISSICKLLHSMGLRKDKDLEALHKNLNNVSDSKPIDEVIVELQNIYNKLNKNQDVNNSQWRVAQWSQVKQKQNGLILKEQDHLISKTQDDLMPKLKVTQSVVLMDKKHLCDPEQCNHDSVTCEKHMSQDDMLNLHDAEQKQFKL